MEALKSSFFVARNGVAPKNGVEFRQRLNGTIRSSLATSNDPTSGDVAKFLVYKPTHSLTKPCMEAGTLSKKHDHSEDHFLTIFLKLNIRQSSFDS